MTYRALDLFCGAGGATKGLQMAGFHVTGVDIKPQPRYIGDEFHQADAMTFPLEGYDLIWASPPCQGYSRTRHLPWLKGKKHPLLIAPTRERFRALDCLTVIENVGDAPLHAPLVLTGGMFGMPFTRLRKFETNFFVMAPERGRSPEGTRGRMFGNRLRAQHERLARWQDQGAVGVGHAGGDAREWMDCRWMGRKEASQAIPPAYAKHIGDYAMMALQAPGPEEGTRS